MIRGLTLALVLAASACGRDKIEVETRVNDDYKHDALVAAVDQFVKESRSAEAYAELAHAVATLRPQMDRTVGREAELRLITLALHPVQAVQHKSIDERVEALALTVWPTLLAPAVAADSMFIVHDPMTPKLQPKPGEDPQQYLMRLCGEALARHCKRVVPELQGSVIEALALRRATERARNAVAECLPCENDPGWKQAVHNWESLDRVANDRVVEIERKGEPDNWPIAGSAAEEDPDLPEAQLSTRGDLIVGGRSYGPNQQRIEVLRELRGKSNVIALHLHPDTTLAQARAILIDARKAGAERVAVIAREPFYPYERKAYWVADGYGLRANLRPTDSLQLLLHSIDEVAGPGTVARVD
jgi:hypothetical protein